jgi:hypothetical protein
MAENRGHTEEARRALFFDKGHPDAITFVATMFHPHDSLSTVVHSGLMLDLGTPVGGLQGAARGD